MVKDVVCCLTLDGKAKTLETGNRLPRLKMYSFKVTSSVGSNQMSIKTNLKVGGFLPQVVIPKRLLCPRVSVLAVSQIVKFGNQATKLAPLHAHRAQLIFVVLGKSTEKLIKCLASRRHCSDRSRLVKCPYLDAPSLRRASLLRRTRTSLKTSLNSPGGECNTKSDAMRT